MGRSFPLNHSPLFLAYDRDLVHRAKEMRKNPTAAERRLWEQCLSKFPHRVLRQRPIDHFIVDFYCAALRLVIEVDGEVHDSEQAKVRDEVRSKILQGYGLQVLRVTNGEVFGEFEKVCERVWGLVGLMERPDPPSPLKKGGLEMEGE